MSDRALFYAVVLIFLIGVGAVFVGLTSEFLAIVVVGLISWIAALVMLVLWFVRKSRSIASG